MKTEISFLLLGVLTCVVANAGTYLGSDQLGQLLVAHPNGYGGQEGSITFNVCILASSPNADLMSAPVKRAIRTWNQFTPTTGESLLLSPDVPGDAADFESVMLHELGHCALGLDHINLVSTTIVPGIPILTDLAQSLDGPNGHPDSFVPVGSVPGFRDNIRNEPLLGIDDENLHWFGKAFNDPLNIGAPVVDRTTYSVMIADLPSIPTQDHQWAASANRGVSEALGFPNTVASMYSFFKLGERRRNLSQDDIATVRMGMAGLDELAGSGSDDYSIALNFAGVTPPASCNVIVQMGTPSGSLAAECSATLVALNRPPGAIFDHVRVQPTTLVFDVTRNWHFGIQPDVFRDGFEYGDLSGWDSHEP